MRSLFAIVFAVIMAGAPSTYAQQPNDTARIWRTYVQRLPIGSTVKLHLQDGETLKAVLFAANEDALTVKPATRVPEPSRRVAYATVRSVERMSDRVSFGMHAAIGGAIGAGVFFLLLASAQ